MNYPHWEIHLACGLIVLLDIAGRSLRIALLARSIGHRLGARGAFLSTIWGDAAAGITPLRFGGEAAKLAGLLRAGLPPGPTVIVLALEVLVGYPVLVGFAIWLLGRYAPEWWAQAAPSLLPALRAGGPWLLVAGVLLVGGGWLWWRRHPRGRAHGLSLRQRLREAASGIRWGLVLLTLPLSLFNIVGRVAILPLLALTLPVHPPMPVLWVGSFVLLYSQLVLPTPAGAGPVELGFLGGAVGSLGTEGGSLLLAWRFYTVGASVVLGAWAALRVVGWEVLRAALRRGGPATGLTGDE